MLVKRISTGILAVVMMGTIMIGSVPAKDNNVCVSAVITASAASKDYRPGVRSGSHGVYVSKLLIIDNALTFTLNSDDDIDAMCQYFRQMELGIGCKPGSYILKLGGGLLSFFGKTSPLNVLSVIFSGVGNHAERCRAAREKLTELSNKYKTRGFKVTLRQGKSVLIELQPADEKLDAAYKRYIQALEDEKAKKEEKQKAKKVYYKACKSSYTSVVDALKSIGVKDTSLTFRRKIYNANNLVAKYGRYSGRSEQNVYMLKLLKKGKLVKP